MRLSTEFNYKQDNVTRDFRTSEIYYLNNPRRYYMVIENTGKKFNLLNLENGNTLFQQDTDYDDMNKILNSYTSSYTFLQDSELILKGTIKTK